MCYLTPNFYCSSTPSGLQGSFVLLYPGLAPGAIKSLSPPGLVELFLRGMFNLPAGRQVFNAQCAIFINVMYQKFDETITSQTSAPTAPA